jgi:hypothetical protein
MKLLTHNFLQCHIKGVENGYPLKIEAVKIDERDADFDPGQPASSSRLRRQHVDSTCCGSSSELLFCCSAVLLLQTFLDLCSSG